MCGILGIIGQKSSSIEYIRKLNNLQYHRGPDSNGIYQDINSNVSLAICSCPLEIIISIVFIIDNDLKLE